MLKLLQKLLSTQEQQVVHPKVDQLEKYFGVALKRVEDRRFLIGEAKYITDLEPKDCLHAVFVRSPYAHAKILDIHTEKAKDLPGVYAVFTARDFDAVGEVPCAANLPFAKYPKYYPIASEEVNFQGEIVAVILAEDEYIARDAEDLIVADYQILPAVMDPEEAIKPINKDRVHKEFVDNVAYSIKQTFIQKGDGDSPSDKADRGVESILSASDHVFSFRLYNQRVFSSAIEARSVIATYDPSIGEITMWTSAQYPHLVRTFVSGAINIPENRLRVIAPDLGGGFGGKSNVYAEEILVPFIAWNLLGGRRPVKWVETRSEHMVSTAHGRDHVQYVDVGVDKNGRIRALRVRIIADIGAYFHFLTPAFPLISAFDIPGNYRIPVYEFEVTCAFTNKKSTDAYRGVGASEACFCIERTMDVVAEELGLDPAEVRLRNYVTPDEYPYMNAMGQPNAPGNLPSGMKIALDVIDYSGFRRRQREEREKDQRYLGVGFSTFWELGGFGPPEMTEAHGLKHGAFESASVRFLPSGSVVITTGSSSHGQGHETAFAQIAADVLQVRFDDITIKHGDTLNTPYGIGTYASRSAAVGGTAIYFACQKILKKAREIAAHLLKIEPDGIVHERGTFFSSERPEEKITMKKVAEEAYLARHLPPEMEPGLETSYYFNPKEATFASGIHACVVEVDTETGKVKVLRYVAINDFGNVINPMIVQGQVHGGVLQGLGQGLLEELVYGRDGEIHGINFLDYLIPTSEDPILSGESAIEVKFYRTDTSANPLGVKGMGESGAIAAPAAVVNAVADALKPFRVKISRMPLKPDFVWQLVHN